MEARHGWKPPNHRKTVFHTFLTVKVVINGHGCFLRPKLTYRRALRLLPKRYVTFSFLRYYLDVWASTQVWIPYHDPRIEPNWVFMKKWSCWVSNDVVSARFFSGGRGWKCPTRKCRCHLELEGDTKHFMASGPSPDWSLKPIGELPSSYALLLLQMVRLRVAPTFSEPEFTH